MKVGYCMCKRLRSVDAVFVGDDDNKKKTK